MSINVQGAGVTLDNGAEAPDIVRSEPPPDSMISKLRRRATAQQKALIKAFPVGGEFGDWLQIRYTPLPPDQLDDFIVRQDEASQERAIQLNMDMMARSCVEVIGFDPSTKTVEVLQDDRGPVKLEHRLAVLLDLPVSSGAILTAREVITILFGRNGLAIGQHGDEVVGWMRKPGDASGES